MSSPSPSTAGSAAEAAPSTSPSPEGKGPGSRRKALTGVAIAVVLVGVVWGTWSWLDRHTESTDNAYVQANVVQITPQVTGTVLAIEADDTDFVKAGQPLVRLDPSDAQVALAQAEAQLAQTVREVRTLYANQSALAAQVAARRADLVRVQGDVARAEDDVNRRTPLLATGAVGREEYNHSTAQLATARSAVAAAQSAVQAAQEQLASNQALIEGTDVAQHPNVQRAAARVKEAYLAVQRVMLPAPVDGYVARRSVQLGQRVQAGTPLMSVVSLGQVWVDANFKEGQLRRLRIGQPATLVADVYGKQVEFHGKVAGLGAGTGAAFALLPAQNATGNWIKVVQRVPVRIVLDANEVAAHPLRVGLSMDVEVDVADQSGKTLADAGHAKTTAQTAAFDAGGAAAQAAVDRIVARNLGRPAKVQLGAAAGGEALPAPPASGRPAAAGEGDAVALASRPR